MLLHDINKLIKSSNITLPPLLIPKHSDHGDYAINTTHLSKKERDKLIKTLSKNTIIKKVETKDSFINIFISESYLLKAVYEASGGTDIFKNAPPHKTTYLIEHTSPNPNKSLHLGHLRNNVLGMSIANIWEFQGITVIRDCIDNNRGIAIAKLMWGYLYFGRKSNKITPTIESWIKNKNDWTNSSLKENLSEFIDSLYTKAAAQFISKKSVENEIRTLALEWERGNKNVLALWKHVLSYSYSMQKQTLKRLESKWDKIWHEHEHYMLGKNYIKSGIKKGIFKKTSEKTIITQFKNNLPNTVVLKSDGTSLYITQDIALTDLKINTFHPNKLFWVIGPEQTLALKQLFRICSQLGIGSEDMFTHIPYGLLSIRGKGKMSSRTGNIIYIDSVLNQAIERAREIISENSRLKKVEIQKAAEIVGTGAVKYSILKVGRLTPIQFDIESSVSLNGNSGPYIQYVYARTQSIITKAQNTSHNINKKSIPDELERNLIITLCRFSDALESAGKNYAPHYICTYLYTLSQQFNTFYESHPIIGSKSFTLRISIVKATAHILKAGLNLLGVRTLDRL